MPWAREQAQCLHCKPPETHLAGSVLPVTRKPCPFLYGLPPPSISRESDEYGHFCSHQCSIILNHQQFLPRPVLISIVTCSISSAVPPSPAPSRPMASRLFIAVCSCSYRAKKETVFGVIWWAFTGVPGTQQSQLVTRRFPTWSHALEIMKFTLKDKVGEEKDWAITQTCNFATYRSEG